MRITDSRLWRYGIAVVSVAIAIALRLVLDPVLGPGRELFTLFLAVVAAAKIGGRGPGLLASLLSVLGAWYFLIQPRFSFAIANPSDVGMLVVFACAGAGISVLVGQTAPAAELEMDGNADPSFLRRAILFVSALLVLAVATRLLYGDFAREKERQNWVTHSYQVLEAVHAVMSNLQEAETGQRGYLLTGDESYLEPFQSALREERTIRKTLRELTADNPVQQASLDSLDRLVEDKFSVLERAIELRRTVGSVAALAVVGPGEGKQIMEQCRVVLQAMEDEDRRLLAQRTQAAEAQSSGMRWVLVLGSSSLMMLLVIAAVVIERDSRYRERARHAMRLSEERVRLAVDAANAGTWEWDLETNENVWSEEVWNLYGLEPHSREPSYDTWCEVIHPDDRVNAQQVVSEAARKGADINVEFRVSGMDNPARWLMARGRLLRNGNGAGRYVGIALDITLRKQAEEVLRAREQDLRRFAEFAPVAIAMFDCDMRYLAVSRRFREDYALGDQELLGRSHYDVFPEIPESWRAIHRRCLGGAVESHRGEQFVRFDGTQQWVRWEVQPWYQTDGRIGGVVLFSEDITRHRQAELEIRQLNSQLEQRVRQRTAQLENANRELEAFAYSVSHDLRAPLRGIDGWSLALAEDYAPQLDARALGYLDRVRSETQRMGMLIDDLLQLSRVTRAEMQFLPVDLTAIAQNIAAELTEANSCRRIDFAIEPGLMGIGDARLLKIALTNLLANAVKFTGTRVEARIELGKAGDNGKAAFYVRDNGVGFDMQYAGKLFRAFQRLHKTSEFPGTGIGLATVQRVIYRHLGRVWAEAQVDGGATFYFTIGETA